MDIEIWLLIIVIKKIAWQFALFHSTRLVDSSPALKYNVWTDSWRVEWGSVVDRTECVKTTINVFTRELCSGLFLG